MTRVSVKVLEEWVLSQPFKHLVKEGERIVVISDSLVDYRYTSLMTSLWGVISLLSKVSALFFGTTWTRLTKTPSYMGLTTPACSSLNTSWFTTFLIAFFSHHWCSQDDLWSDSINMQWIHKSGLIYFLVLERIPNDWPVLSLGLQWAAESHFLSACHWWRLACYCCCCCWRKAFFSLGGSGFSSRRRCCSFSSSLSLRWPPGSVS